MQLVGYNFEEDVICAIEDYERDKNPSLNGIVEEFVKGVLYDSGYLRNDLSDEEIFTPKELNNIDNFSKKHWGDNRVQIKYGDLQFGSFDEKIVDEIIFKLARLSDEDLTKYSKTYCKDMWGYSYKDHHDFILAWLDNPLMKPSELNLVKRAEYPSSASVEFYYKRKRLGAFNKKKYSAEKIDEVESFLNKFSAPQLQKISEMRKECNSHSDKFILNLMENPQEIEGIIGGK